MGKRRKWQPQRPQRGGGGRRTRTWLLIGCAALLALALAGLIAIQVLPTHTDHHAHPVAPHGGVVVPVGDGTGHYHAEFVFGPTGAVDAYLLGDPPVQAATAEPQHLIAEIHAAGDALPTPVVLRPDTGGSGDSPVSRFLGRLPADLLGRPLTLRINRIVIGGKTYSIELSWAGGPPAEDLAARASREQEELYLRPGGRYTETDIAAAGRQTAAARYCGRRPDDDLYPRAGDRICPVTGLKAGPEFTWVIGGQSYLFCCAPCIDAFVALAKNDPDRVKEPGAYVKQR